MIVRKKVQSSVNNTHESRMYMLYKYEMGTFKVFVAHYN